MKNDPKIIERLLFEEQNLENTKYASREEGNVMECYGEVKLTSESWASGNLQLYVKFESSPGKYGG